MKVNLGLLTADSNVDVVSSQRKPEIKQFDARKFVCQYKRVSGKIKGHKQ